MNFIHNKESTRNVKYDSLDKLEKGLGLVLQNSRNVTICGYKMITTTAIPFTKYLMIYNMEKTRYEFPVAYYDFSIKNILVYIAHYLYRIIYENMPSDINGAKIIDSIDIFKQNIRINGCKLYDERIYLFVDLSYVKMRTEFNYSNRFILEWGLFIDFVNTKKIYDKKINVEDCDFVSNNIDLFLLRDQNQILYETPHSGYIGTEKEKVNYIFNFGPIKSWCEREFGACYYFTNYKNVEFNEAFVRFALFYGNCKVIQNFPNDKIDDSLIKKNKMMLYNNSDLQNDRNHYEMTKSTMRITDHDGLWQSLTRYLRVVMMRAAEKKALIAMLVHSCAKSGVTCSIISTSAIMYVVLVEKSECPLVSASAMCGLIPPIK